jgi:hypothetical protein
MSVCRNGHRSEKPRENSNYVVRKPFSPYLTKFCFVSDKNRNRLYNPQTSLSTCEQVQARNIIEFFCLVLVTLKRGTKNSPRSCHFGAAIPHDGREPIRLR